MLDLEKLAHGPTFLVVKTNVYWVERTIEGTPAIPNFTELSFFAHFTDKNSIVDPKIIYCHPQKTLLISSKGTTGFSLK